MASCNAQGAQILIFLDVRKPQQKPAGVSLRARPRATLSLKFSFPIEYELGVKIPSLKPILKNRRV